DVSSRLRAPLAEIRVWSEWTRQCQRERRSYSDLADHKEVSVHRPRQVSTDRQAQARSLVCTAQRAAELYEGLKDRLRLVIRDSNSCVSDRDRGSLFSSLTLDRDPPARLRELHRIREKIQQDLISLDAISHRHAI